MDSTDRSIKTLVDWYLVRELQLPEMQRRYVWRATQSRDLLDSIYRDYPSGSILIWETDTPPETKTPSFGETGQSPIYGKKLQLLDGQQRITSLASILTGRPIRIKEGNKIREKIIDIYFNIDHPDESNIVETPDFEVGDSVEAKWTDEKFYPGTITAIENNRYYIVYDDSGEGWTDEVQDLGEENKKELYFQIKSRKIENKSNWISVTKLFKEGVGSILTDLKIGSDDPNFSKYNKRLNQLYNRKDYYTYPIQIIRDKKYNEVTDIFTRVNSAGTKLRGSDLALAQITSSWPGSMKLFENFTEQCVSNNFYLDENFLVRCIVSIATNQAKFDNVSRIPVPKLKAAWELTKKGVQNTINFLKNNAFVDSSALLPSQMLLVPLVYYSSQNDLSKTPETEKGFLNWFYNAAIWGRYSSSMETKLSQDLTVLSKDKPWINLTENIWQVVGKDRIVTVGDIRGKGIGSPFFFMMYVLAKKDQARDLQTGNIINYTNFGNNNKIENDHIFPKSKLDSFFKDKIKEDSERKKIINEVANIAFMGKKGNIIKTNDDPLVYFPKVYGKYGKNIFDKQSIPYDSDLNTYEKYEEFLNARAAILVEKANSFLAGLKG